MYHEKPLTDCLHRANKYTSLEKEGQLTAGLGCAEACRKLIYQLQGVTYRSDTAASYEGQVILNLGEVVGTDQSF